MLQSLEYENVVSVGFPSRDDGSLSVLASVLHYEIALVWKIATQNGIMVPPLSPPPPDPPQNHLTLQIRWPWKPVHGRADSEPNGEMGLEDFAGFGEEWIQRQTARWAMSREMIIIPTLTNDDGDDGGSGVGGHGENFHTTHKLEI